MTAFQVAGLALSGLMVAVSTRALIGRAGSRAAPLFWLLVWSAAALAFAFPDATTWVAHIIGIERGVDLVMYCAVLAGALGFWLVSLRLRAQSQEITQLTRHIALLCTEQPDNPENSGSAAAPVASGVDPAAPDAP